MDLGLLEELRQRFPGVRLLAGGGVLARRDLDGCGTPAATARWWRAPSTPARITAADLAALAGASRVGAQSPSVSR